MITATQARALINLPDNQNATAILNEIEASIMLTARQGYSSIKWEKQLPAWVRQELTASGYRVIYDSLNIDVVYIISWKARCGK